MKLVKLIDITLLESSVTASAYDEYDDTKTYDDTTDYVKVSFASDGITARTPVEEYLSLANANLDNYPPDDSTNWSLLGASNEWKMFDGYVNSQTSDTSDIAVEITSSNTNKIGLFDLQGSAVTLTQIVNIELITNGDCTADDFTKGTGWSYDAGVEYDCSGAQVADSKLYQIINPTVDKKYIVKFTVKNYSAGNVAGTIGGISGTDVAADGDYVQIITVDPDTYEDENGHAYADGYTDTLEGGVVADSAFIGSVDDISIMRIANDETIDIDLDVSFTPDYWYYFFSDFTYKEDISWDYSFYANSKIRIEITTQGGTAKCGMGALGRSVTLGTTRYEPHISIDDYSKKDTDTLGRTYLNPGNYAKKNDIDFWLDNDQVDIVRRALADVRGTAVITDANSESTDFGSLIIYGFIKNFDIIVPGPNQSKCSLEIEGLI